MIPPAPSGLVATAVSVTQINLSWTSNSVNETGFKIERKTGAAGTYSQIATVGAGVVTTMTPAWRQIRLTFIVCARRMLSEIPPILMKPARRRSSIAPAAPSGLTATAASTTQINLTWTDNSSDETGFKIERKTGTGGTYAQIATVGASVTTYSNTGLAIGTNYFYRVRATNAGGDSAYSNAASATTLTTLWPDTAVPAIPISWMEFHRPRKAYVSTRTVLGGSRDCVFIRPPPTRVSIRVTFGRIMGPCLQR